MAKQELSSLAVSAFCEDLAMMLGAGIQAEEAVGLLCEDSGATPFHAAAAAVHGQLLAGDTLAQAAQASGAFPAYAVRMIAAGEVAGRTEAVLRGLARHYAGQDRLQKKLKSAVVYPAVLLALMAAILAVLLAAVLPVFRSVYLNLTGDLTSSAYGYIRLAYGVGWAGLAATLALALALVAGGLAGRGPAGRARLARIFEKLPFTARAARQLAVSRFTSALAIFVASGVDVDTAMDAAGEMVAHAGVKAQVDACEAQMAGGDGLAKAIYDQKLFEPLYGRMLVSGARSGQLEEVLGRLAQLFTQDADDQLDGLIDSIEPALAGFLTVAVGATLLSVMLPLIGILGSMW